MHRIISKTFLFTIGVLGLTACGSDVQEASSVADEPASEAPSSEELRSGGGEEVRIETFIYQPDPLATSIGTEVVWTQLDATTHTVTSGTREDGPDGLFDASLGQGEEFRFTFDEPGTYPYYCTRHSGPGMTGEIVVGSAGGG